MNNKKEGTSDGTALVSRTPSASPGSKRLKISSSSRSAKTPSAKLPSHYDDVTLSGTKRQRKQDDESASSNPENYNQGRWTKFEHYRFLEALKLYGKEWQKVQQHVNTRTSTQARSHAQKFFVKLERKRLNLEEFLEHLDLEVLKRDLGLFNGCANSTEYDEDEAFNQARHLSAREDTPKKGAKGSIMNIALPPDAPDEELKSARADSESFPARESMPAEDSHKSPVHEEPVGRATVLKRQAKINHAFFSKSYLVDAVKVGSSPLSKGGSGKRRGRKRKRPEAEVAIPEEEEDEKEAGAVEQEDGFDTAAPGKHTPESNAAHRQGGGVLLRAAEAHAA